MDLKNLLSSLGALSNFISNQNQQPQQQNQQNSNNVQNFCYYPQDFSSQEQKVTLQEQKNEQINVNQLSNINQNYDQNHNFNFSQLLPILSLLFNKNLNLSALSSNDNEINKLSQILGLLTKQEEKPKLPSIDSFKKIE